jgi:hypothetical protein
LRLVTICFLSPSMFASHMALSLAVGREETVATGDWSGYFGPILPPSRARDPPLVEKVHELLTHQLVTIKGRKNAK